MDKFNLTSEQEEALINCGAFNYNAEKVANIIDISQSIIENQLKDVDSNIYKLYKKGKDMYEYTIDCKLFELVQSGDLSALDKLEKRKWANNYKNL